MILLIDNYDSFSYNLYQLIGSIIPDIKVIRNDEMSALEIEALAPSHIVLSPGPGRPEEAGVCGAAVESLGGKVPILGVCLGLQVIYETYGGVVSYAGELMHGKCSRIIRTGECELFNGLPDTFEAARYHSLSAVRETMPRDLIETAQASDGEIMAVSHKKHKVFGVQFHPESIMTPDGSAIIENFLRLGEPSGRAAVSVAGQR